MSPLANADVYPKTIMLRDGTRVELRLLDEEDKARLLRFFVRVPEADRYLLKENVTAPEVIRAWVTRIDFERVIPIVAVVDDEIVGDATLHRSREPARRHVGELRVVVEPDYRERGLGRRLIRELLDIALELGLYKASFELVVQGEKAAIVAAESMGFQEVARFKGWILDFWGNYHDLVVMELALKEHKESWRF